MAYKSNTSRLENLATSLAALNAGKALPSLKAASQPKPPTPPGGPTDPDNPFGVTDATAAARFIVSSNERRMAGCPAITPTNPTAAFIVDTVAKLRAKI